MNQTQQGQYTGKGYIYQQLTLPISENILIDEHEPVYVANAQLEELDYAATHQVVFSPQKCCISKVESGINKGHSDLQITIRIVTFSENTSMQLTQGEIRNKEMPFRIADNSKHSELQMTKISRAASSKSLPVILEVESGINKGCSDLQITNRPPLTSWARIPFVSAIRHKQIGFIFTANQKAHPVTFPCCLWIKQVGKRPGGPQYLFIFGA